MDENPEIKKRVPSENQGTRPQGVRPQGTRPQGSRPQGARPQGTRSQGSRPQGARPGTRSTVKRKKSRKFKTEFKILLSIIVTLLFLLIIGLLATIFSKKGSNSSSTTRKITPAGNTTEAAAKSTDTPSPTPSPKVTSTPTVSPTETPTPTITTTPVPTSSATKADLKVSGGYAIIGDTVWTLYNYKTANGETYAKAINALRTKLDNTYNIYDILVPISSDITFPEHLKEFTGSSNQKDAIADMYSKIDPSIKTVNVFDSLYANRGEYVYYRTDHHWTSYGAYLAYAEFLKAKGLEAAPRESYQINSYPGFLGSYYELFKLNTQKDNPDTVDIMMPKSDTVMELTATDGSTKIWPMINDVTKFTARTKFYAFLGGDYPYTKITNSKITNGSACILVKESYGNVFAPFLTDNYEYVYVVDYRFYRGSFSKLVKELGATDIIILNNMSTTANTKLLGQLYNLLSY